MVVWDSFLHARDDGMDVLRALPCAFNDGAKKKRLHVERE